MHVPTGEIFNTYHEATLAHPEGSVVLLEGPPEAIEQISRAVSAQYRAERKAKNKAAKLSRRANRGK